MKFIFCLLNEFIFIIIIYLTDLHCVKTLFSHFHSPLICMGTELLVQLMCILFKHTTCGGHTLVSLKEVLTTKPFDVTSIFLCK